MPRLILTAVALPEPYLLEVRLLQTMDQTKRILPTCVLLAATVQFGHGKSDKNSGEQTLFMSMA